MTLTNEQKRQQSGRDMEESRRASGRKMRDDMRALAENNRLERKLPELPVRGSQPAKRGSAVWTGGAPSSGGGGGGIASPLNEQPGTRKYHSFAPVIVMPDDGFFFYSTVAVKTLTFKDSNDEVVIVNLEPPTYESTP